MGLLTESGYPHATGESVVWGDRLVRGLAQHEFEVFALSRDERQAAAGLLPLPPHVTGLRTAPLWGPAPSPGRRSAGRRTRRAFAECFAELAAAVSGSPGAGGAEAAAGAGAGAGAGMGATGGAGAADGDAAGGAAGAAADPRAARFADGLYGLAALARETRAVPALLRSDTALRLLAAACGVPGATRGAHAARLADLAAVAAELERALRPLSLDWYGPGPGGAGLGAADLCHAASGGTAALAGLVAKRFFGVPLLLTEYGVRLREHYLDRAAGAAGAPARALLASYRRLLAGETYARAALITPGTAHARRWQERCGAPRGRVRTVHPGLDPGPFEAVTGEDDVSGPAGGGGTAGNDPADGYTLVWAGGPLEPAADVVGLLHAFAVVRRSEPRARLRIVESGPPRDPAAAGYSAHCRALAAQLFPDEAPSPTVPGENPVSFERIGAPEAPTAADVYASCCLVVRSSAIDGFPTGLVEAMLCGRATVSTDAGAVCEVIGGTGLVVPPRNPRALADACTALLRDPRRRARLGAAARSRALELFTVEQNLAAFRGIYLELMSHRPAAAPGPEGAGGRLPFALPPEARVPGRWAAPAVAARRSSAVAAGRPRVPSWAVTAARPAAAGAPIGGTGS
ncbi:DUF3492 domain-containing protein [Streptomyces lycii]|uniref:DUF3492 domain-containing protein n=1 Tax=Streptomyces lycii TaxID=2654337 RepID=UPI0038B57E65